MGNDDILYHTQDHVAVITLNRPDRMNSFTDDMLRDWADAIQTASCDEDVRVVLVTGAGKAFCAGADLKAKGDANNVLRPDATISQRRNTLRFTVHRVAQALQYLDKPYIAAVNGPAVGAGMDMCSQADIRIAADTARFGMSYVKVGLIPGDGGAWLLPRIVGIQRALDLIWSGELFDAYKAQEIGYVLKVVEHDQLLDEAMAYARKLCEGPPIAIQMAKRLVYRGLDTTLMEALEQAQAAMTIVQSTRDATEGPLAFVEKRKPEFRGN